MSSTAKWQDDFVYTKLYLALPFSMSNLRTDCQQVRAAEVSAGSVQMTVRRSAGVEVVKGSVRSAWYAELNFISAFGVEVALADEAECIGVKGRKCENGLQFRIRRRGASRGYSLPACVSTAPSGNRKGGKNRLIFNRRARPNCMSIDYNLVQACDPALAHFTQKNE